MHSHFQNLLCEVESLKPKVHAVQVCQSALRIPEDVVTSLPLCHAALQLQEEASRLQHAAIQQCNVLQACAGGQPGSAGVPTPAAPQPQPRGHGLPC